MVIGAGLLFVSGTGEATLSTSVSAVTPYTDSVAMASNPDRTGYCLSSIVVSACGFDVFDIDATSSAPGGNDYPLVGFR